MTGTMFQRAGRTGLNNWPKKTKSWASTTVI